MNKLKSLLIIFLFNIAFVSVGQLTPPGPPPCPSNGEKGKVGDNGAPLEDGVWLTLGMAFLYGAYQYGRTLRKDTNPATDNNMR